jgi:hypothetical protein
MGRNQRPLAGLKSGMAFALETLWKIQIMHRLTHTEIALVRTHELSHIDNNP